QVGLAMHYAVGIGVAHDRAPMVLGGAQAVRKEIAVDVFHLTRQHAQADLRGGTVVRGAERAAARVGDLDGLAGLGAIAIGDIAGENPGVPAGHTVGAFAADLDLIHRVHRAACKRAIRSSVEGWVENRRMMLLPVNGLMMNMCAVEGEASMGMRLDQDSSFSSPPISG